ncbi:MAG: hypothetical protein IKR25_13060, partial [Muribaculaceae bacterium]|nr:hypothetical protein [Muribaculaceae bacterium]
MAAGGREMRPCSSFILFIQVSQVDFFAQEQSCSLVVEDHNKATALNYLKPEGVSKLWNNDSACP